jgi:ribonuclease P/MRP protein subunit POP5
MDQPDLTDDFLLTLATVKYLSLATSTAIIRCSRTHYKMLWSALTFMDAVPTKDGPGRPCIFRVVRVSGTIRKAEEEAIRQAKQLILAAKGEAGTGSGLLRSEDLSATHHDLMDIDVANDSENDDDDDLMGGSDRD